MTRRVADDDAIAGRVKDGGAVTRRDDGGTAARVADGGAVTERATSGADAGEPTTEFARCVASGSHTAGRGIRLTGSFMSNGAECSDCSRVHTKTEAA